MNDYPTQEQLDKIERWKGSYLELMAYVRQLWHLDGYGFRESDSKFHLSTGGWSGNEEIIMALERNLVFWGLFWLLSRRGGHYVFDKKFMAKLDAEKKHDSPE